MRRWLLGLIASLLWTAAAEAHKASDSYLTISVGDEAIHGQWDIALRDLEHALGLDQDADGVITWGELRDRHAAIEAYALPRLEIRADGEPCATGPSELLIDEHSDGTYAVLRFPVACPSGVRSLDLRYRLLFDLDPLHRGLVRIDDQGRSHSAVLAPEADRLVVTLATVPDRGAQALSYGREGIWHIWIGFDHILFLVTLLLPAVVQRRDGRWQPVAAFGTAFLGVAKVVTAFTVAHSLTLSLAALGMIAVPTRLVEAVIAASVVLAALNNVWPIVTRRLWLVAFGFGLIHGLGFATNLQDLGLPRDALVVSLLAFNLGVELGQLVIVALLLPMIFVLRRVTLFPQLALRLGSLAIAAVGLAWLVERAFDLELL